MKAAVLLVALLLALLIPGQAGAASQIAPKDGLWLSMPPDSVKCIVIRLPWDAGITEPGDYVFSVGCSPSPGESWADLSEQIVREVHENNTADIPVCFSTAGDKPVGNCSAPYTITLSEKYTETHKEWHGGICVSERGDIDIVKGDYPGSGEDVKDTLNSNTDIFAAWLEEETLYAKPGGQAVFNLSVQSYAALDINILTQSDLGINPGQAQLSTSEESPHHYRTFSVTAPPVSGTHAISFRVGSESCRSGMAYCTKFIEGTFVVSENDPPEETGFGVTLTPENIDVKKPREVLFTLKVKNNGGEPITFTSSVSVDPIDGQTGFHGETFEIGPYSSRTKIFTVLPGESSLYEVTATAVSEEAKSSATSFITLDELKTDAMRQAEGLDDKSELDAWLSSHENSEYGSDLREYGDLKAALAAAQSNQEKPPQNATPVDDDPDDEEPQGMGWIILPLLMACAGLVVAVLVLRSRGSGKKEQNEYY
jgi:hypothetical protein